MMNLQECAKALGITEVTLKYHLRRTQENYLKKGIIITKTGRGEKAQFDIKRIGE